MLRVTSPQVPRVDSPHAASAEKTAGRSSTRIQWSWTFWRTVRSATPRAYRSARAAMVSSWGATRKPLGMRMRSMKQGTARPSPPLPPTAPTPSP